MIEFSPTASTSIKKTQTSTVLLFRWTFKGRCRDCEASNHEKDEKVASHLQKKCWTCEHQWRRHQRCRCCCQSTSKKTLQKLLLSLTSILLCKLKKRKMFYCFLFGLFMVLFLFLLHDRVFKWRLKVIFKGKIFSHKGSKVNLKCLVCPFIFLVSTFLPFLQRPS